MLVKSLLLLPGVDCNSIAHVVCVYCEGKINKAKIDKRCLLNL